MALKVEIFFIPYLTQADMMLLHHPASNDVAAYRAKSIGSLFFCAGNRQCRRYECRGRKILYLF